MRSLTDFLSCCSPAPDGYVGADLTASETATLNDAPPGATPTWFWGTAGVWESDTSDGAFGDASQYSIGWGVPAANVTFNGVFQNPGYYIVETTVTASLDGGSWSASGYLGGGGTSSAAAKASARAAAKLKPMDGTAPSDPSQSSVTCNITATAPPIGQYDGGSRGPGSTSASCAIYMPTLSVTAGDLSPNPAYVTQTTNGNPSATLSGAPPVTQTYRWTTGGVWISPSNKWGSFSGDSGDCGTTWTGASASPGYTAVFNSPGYYILQTVANVSLTDNSGNSVWSGSAYDYTGSVPTATSNSKIANARTAKTKQANAAAKPADDAGTAKSEVAVGIDSIQYQASGGSPTTVAGTLYVFKGSSIQFTAVPSPTGTSFPGGQPTWGGSSGASGSGATVSVTFSSASAKADDFKIVTATCGKQIVTVNVIVVTLTLQQNGTDVTGQTESDVIGQGVTLNAVFQPSGFTPPAGNYSWQLPSGITAGLVVSGDSSTGAEGTLAATTSTASSYHFYWKTTDGGSVTVTYPSIAGATATTAFTVSKPTGIALNSAHGTVCVASDNGLVLASGNPLGFALLYDFSKASIQGEWELIQVSTNTTWDNTPTPASGAHAIHVAYTNAVDGPPPYGKLSTAPPTDTTYGTPMQVLSDTPEVSCLPDGVLGNWLSASKSNQFTDWILFKPSNVGDATSITMIKYGWEWNGTVNETGNDPTQWTINPAENPKQTSSFTAASDLPSWTSLMPLGH